MSEEVFGEDWRMGEQSVSVGDDNYADTGNGYTSLKRDNSRINLVQRNPPAAPSTVFTSLDSSYIEPCESERSCRCSTRRHRRHRSKHQCGHGNRNRALIGLTESNTDSVRAERYYRNSKVWICLLCILNLVLAAVTAALLVTSQFQAETETDDKPFKLCTECQPLNAKLGYTIPIVENIVSKQNSKICCFRRVDQLLELMELYNRAFVKEKLEDLTGRLTSPSHKPSLPSEPIAAHIFYSTNNYSRCTGDTCILEWETSGTGIRMKGFGMERDMYLVIRHAGFYYMYSEIRFKNKQDGNTHRILIGSSPNFKPTDSIYTIGENDGMAVGPNSFVQRVLRLDKNDRICVYANVGSIDTNGVIRQTYFGIFKL